MRIVPNLITLMRLFLVPVTVWLLLTLEYGAAFAVFVIAGVSDGIDGYLARKLDARTRLGAVLDPIADKVLLVSIFVTLGWLGHVPLWLVILIVSRDVLIVGAYLISESLDEPVRIRPTLSSKVNTALQIILAATVLGALSFGWALVTVREVLVWSVAATTLISGGGYVMIWLREISQDTDKKEKPIDDSELVGTQMIDLMKERQDDVAQYRARLKARKDEPRS